MALTPALSRKRAREKIMTHARFGVGIGVGIDPDSDSDSDSDTSPFCHLPPVS